MDYNRLFYMNITYSCNNKCPFCISHNTKKKSKTVVNPMDIIENTNNKYHIDNKDIFVINGGEPTLSLELKKILLYLIELKCKIIVYTNGRLIDNFSIFFSYSNVYWIIPFYGLEDLHDKYTGVSGAFLETLSNLKSIQNRKNISVKFLINEEGQIEQFHVLAEILKPYINEIHISFILNHNFSHRYQLTNKVNSLVKFLRNNFVIKLSNIPLCQLNIELNPKLLNINRIEDYYYISENKEIIKINYDKNHNWQDKCKTCSLLNICCDTLKKYRVLKLNNELISLEEE